MWFSDFRQLSDVIITSHPTHTNKSLFMTNGIRLPEEQRNSSCFCVIKRLFERCNFLFSVSLCFVCVYPYVCGAKISSLH